jgi:hypothetical protein
MSMTVKQIIAALRKMPPGATVAFCAHDQDSDVGEYDGIVRKVEEASPQAKRHHGAGVIIR